MKTITLKNSTLVTTVDDEDYERVSAYEWRLVVSTPFLSYAMRVENKQTILLHRVILNAPAGTMVDHRDFDGLNNQRSNLRLCSPAQNVCNKRKHVTQGLTSRFKGVHLMPTYRNSGPRNGKPRAKPWVAQIMISGRKISRFFVSEEDAARGYDSLAKEFHGEFAALNFAN